MKGVQEKQHQNTKIRFDSLRKRVASYICTYVHENRAMKIGQ